MRKIVKESTHITWNGQKIGLTFVYPPIPTRNFDYCAYIGDEENQNYGYGKSAEIAIAELIQYLYESGSGA